jgi:hypothetical protein
LGGGVRWLIYVCAKALKVRNYAKTAIEKTQEKVSIGSLGLQSQMLKMGSAFITGKKTVHKA